MRESECREFRAPAAERERKREIPGFVRRQREREMDIPGFDLSLLSPLSLFSRI